MSEPSQILVTYINRFNEIIEKNEITKNVKFLNDYEEKKKEIEKEVDKFKAKKPDIYNTYIKNYEKHKHTIKLLIDQRKEDDLNKSISTESKVAYSGERFLKNAVFSTFLGVVFASFFTFRGDELD